MALLLNRLSAVADMVSQGEPVADIGADHALLSIYLVEKGVVPHAIIGELGDGPYSRALQAVRESGNQDKIEVRQGDGLRVLNNGEVHSIVLAGMGGNTIEKIISYDWDKACSFKRYIFQPMSKVGLLRRELACKGWPLIDEQIIEENGHFYAIIVSQPGYHPYSLSDLEMELGPKILRADNPAKLKFLQLCVQNYDKIYGGLKGSRLQKNKQLALVYKKRIDQLEAIINASQG